MNDLENAETNTDISKPVQEKPAKKKNGNWYFVKEQEDSFRKFLVCENDVEKERIFERDIYPALCKMIECLIRRYYLFTIDESYEDTFNDTMSFLIMKIKNFNPEKKCKAYSYCGTICKHYLILKRKKSIKKNEKNISYDIVYGNSEKDKRVVNDGIYEENLQERIISTMKEVIIELLKTGKTDKRELTNNEVKVGNALIQVLEHWEDMIDNRASRKFNKLSLYYFIREYTMCKPHEVRNAMKLYKSLYLLNKQKLLNNDT